MKTMERDEHIFALRVRSLGRLNVFFAIKLTQEAEETL